MRLRSSLFFTFLLSSMAAGCGDDTATTGGGGTGGAGGQPADGGSGGVGGQPPEKAALGEPCEANEACEGGLCLTEAYFGWASGYCSALCEPSLSPCEIGTCVGTPSGSNVCLKECEGPMDCSGPGQDCTDIGDVTPLEVCVGGCHDDGQCEHACDQDNAVCVANNEACDNHADDDGDGLHDCMEADCATDAGCTAAIGDACESPTVLSDGVPVSDTTASGTDLFASVCTNILGDFVTGLAHEKVYRYTASAEGVLTVSALAQDGDLALYLRSACDADTSVVACADAQTLAGYAESIALDVQPGDSFYIFVDAYSLGDEGDYELTATLQPKVCGDGVIVGDEQCDDANTTSGDGCSGTCTLEPTPFCASAAIVDVLADTPVAGDTGDGTQGFSGECGGDGRELVYRYVPTSDANVRVTVSTLLNTEPFDMVLYTRSACDDDATEILCRDEGIAGDDETMLLPATTGVPIFIYVDSYTTPGAFSLIVHPS